MQETTTDTATYDGGMYQYRMAVEDTTASNYPYYGPPPPPAGNRKERRRAAALARSKRGV